MGQLVKALYAKDCRRLPTLSESPVADHNFDTNHRDYPLHYTRPALGSFSSSRCSYASHSSTRSPFAPPTKAQYKSNKGWIGAILLFGDLWYCSIAAILASPDQSSGVVLNQWSQPFGRILIPVIGLLACFGALLLLTHIRHRSHFESAAVTHWQESMQIRESLIYCDFHPAKGKDMTREDYV